MNKKQFLVFDYGASHGRCSVAKFDGSRFEMEVVHEFDNRPVEYAGTLYWDILRLSSELKIGIQKAFKEYPNIESVGIDTWGCDFGFIDKNGKLLANPVNYRDELRHKYKPKLDEEFGEYNLFRLGGVNTNAIMGLYHLYGMIQEKATELEYADKFLMIPDLLNYYLTGIAANEYTDATMSLMVDQTKKTWQTRIIEPLGINKDIFSTMVMPGNVLGSLQKSICEDFDVKPIKVINVCSHDTASAIAGIPITEKNKNWAFISLGTWAIFGVETDQHYVSEEVFASGFANQGGCEGKTNFVDLFTGLWVIQQCYEKWCRDEGKKIGWDAVVEAASSVQGGKAFIDLDAPDFVQPNPNMPKQIQQYCAATNQPIPDGMGEIARCVYESLALKFKRCRDNIEKFTDKKIEVLHIVGGGSKNKLLCQWTSDALGVPVISGPAETTSVGNLLMQLKGTGEIANLAEGREISAKSANPIKYYPSGTDIWDEYSERYLKTIGN